MVLVVLLVLIEGKVFVCLYLPFDAGNEEYEGRCISVYLYDDIDQICSVVLDFECI